MASTSTVIEEQSTEQLWGGGTAPMKASYGKLMMWFFLLSDAFTFSGLLIAYGYARFRNFAYEGEVADFLVSKDAWPIPEKIFDAAPFLGSGYPLVFVGIMTFILIMSSVTMVLAVEAGHRMDKKAVEKWMLWTILGGFTFLGCQAWEWAHFIHGTESIVGLWSGGYEGQFAQILSGASIVDGGLEIASVSDLAIMAPNLDGEVVKVTGEAAKELLFKAVPVEGASLSMNEYGPPAFAGFFFFITGFHGTHVFSGVVLNIIIFYNVATNLYQRRGHYEMVEKVGLYWHFVDLVWVFVFTFFYLL